MEPVYRLPPRPVLSATACLARRGLPKSFQAKAGSGDERRSLAADSRSIRLIRCQAADEPSLAELGDDSVRRPLVIVQTSSRDLATIPEHGLGSEEPIAKIGNR